jgi:ribonuclease BN (tRNA processing enzyme)
VRLDVIGAGPAYTNLDDASGACYLVRDGATALLLDLGQGSFPRLFRHLDPVDLAAIVVSHLHPDHFVDLVPLRHYLRYEFSPPRRARVLAPRGLTARLDGLHGQAGFAAEILDVEPLGETIRILGSLQLEARLVVHTEESYAFRVSAGGGPGVVYSGDCDRVDDLAPLVRPGDALLVEVSFGAGPVPEGAPHLDGPMVGRLAAATAAGRVLLTHLQMGFDAIEAEASVRRHYDGPVGFVRPGSSILV